MDKYAYAMLALALLAPLVVIFCLRKDLRHKILILGLAGGIAGLLAEMFYFRDYWRPPSVIGTGVLSPEDFIIGFALTGLSFATYPFLRKRRYMQSGPNRDKTFLTFFAAGLAAMLALNIGLGINSVIVSCALFLIFAAIIIWRRPELAPIGLYSTTVLLLYITAIYALLFNLSAPHFWRDHWLLSNTPWGITVLGNLPLTELAWYFCWIIFASISHPFGSGDILTGSDATPEPHSNEPVPRDTRDII